MSRTRTVAFRTTDEEDANSDVVSDPGTPVLNVNPQPLTLTSCPFLRLKVPRERDQREVVEWPTLINLGVVWRSKVTPLPNRV